MRAKIARETIHSEQEAKKPWAERMLEVTLEIPGFLHDADKADTSDILLDAYVPIPGCEQLYHRKQFDSFMRFLLPLITVYYSVKSYNECRHFYMGFLDVAIAFLCIHILIGAYPLLCCGRPAFDILDIFTDCFRECMDNVQEFHQWWLPKCACLSKCKCGGTQAKAPPACTCCSKIPPQVTMVLNCIVQCYSPITKCFGRLWRFGSVIFLWSVIFMGFIAPMVDFSQMGTPLRNTVELPITACFNDREISSLCFILNAALTGVRLAYGSDGQKNGKTNFYTKFV